MSIIDSLLNLIVPHLCLGCSKEGTLLCDRCAALLPGANVEQNLINLDDLTAATIYEDVAKDLLWQLKAGGAQAAAKVMARRMVPLVPPGPEYILVPVPTATSRVRQRGYDQAKLIARSLSRQSGLQYKNCLVRLGQTHQVGSSRLNRLEQIKNRLIIKNAHGLAGASVVLIDDVVTTGATLETAANLLKSAGASRVAAITFAYARLKPTAKHEELY